MEIPHQINIDPENKQKIVEANLSAPHLMAEFALMIGG